MKSKKIDCRICLFNLIPKITGGSKIPIVNTDIYAGNYESLVPWNTNTAGVDNAAIMDCFFAGLWTYHISDRTNFKCAFFRNRGKTERGYSKGKIFQYEEIHNDDPNIKDVLIKMWKSYDKIRICAETLLQKKVVTNA